MSTPSTFFGYRRENRRVGVRNYVAILPVDDISNAACEAVAAIIFEAIALTDGARLPGTSRLEHRKRAIDDGLLIPPALHDEITSIINSGSRNA